MTSKLKEIHFKKYSAQEAERERYIKSQLAERKKYTAQLAEHKKIIAEHKKIINVLKLKRAMCEVWTPSDYIQDHYLENED